MITYQHITNPAQTPKKSTKQIFNNLSLSFIALFFGYMLWYILGAQYPITIQCEIPLSFFNNSKAVIIQAPEMLSITLKATRRELYRSLHTLAAHIDVTQLPTGTSSLKITSAHLLLPDTILLLHYQPVVITKYTQDAEHGPHKKN